MSDSGIHLGAFEVRHRLGEGGMGAVYRGEHRTTGVPVALKVIKREADESARRRFHREVQAHAGLQHPGVVYLFEYGNIDEKVARQSDGELSAGDPFVAMELAGRGTVRDAMPLDWKMVCRMLVQILDALAYSHARGVVHRDLKPENFLVFDTDDGDTGWRVKLADFGIAHAFGTERDVDTEALESAAGTPHYMAPEQMRGRWREYGPWTDLYAVGCITWELICGRPPYRGGSMFDIMVSHEEEPIPPLEPQFPVPEELESWIHRAMAVDPDRRFRRAADAVWALPRQVLADSISRDQRDEPDRAHAAEETRTIPVVTESIRLPETAELPDTREFVGETLSSRDPESPDLSDNREQVESLFAEAHPPVPQDWRPEPRETIPAPLVGAGIGLFGLRDPPFVNRQEACDRIWGALHEVVEQQSTRLVDIAGEPGTGKSRLADWLSTRAHEVGAARTLRLVHTPAGGPAEGLRGALERTLRTLKLDRAEVFEHLSEVLVPLSEDEDGETRRRDARALTEYLRPMGNEVEEVVGPRFRFDGADQRRRFLVRVLRRLACERPMLLWVDDLQWGDDMLGLIEHLFDDGVGELSALFLVTTRSDLVAERKQFAARLDALHESSASTRLSLDPLQRDHQLELLERLLPLEPTFAERLAERTEGHPLFAMQLLGHWIERDAIEVNPDGFRLRSADSSELPGDVRELWLERVARLVRDRGFPEEPTFRALECAAVLGREVVIEEWTELVADLELEEPYALVDVLVARGLAERTREGWSFAHGLFVESLEQFARQKGRLRKHHRRCAQMLEARYDDQPRETAARRADHWLAAGRKERALEPLLDESRRLFELGEFEREQDVLEERRRHIDALELPENDSRRLENELESIWLDLTRGASPEDELEDLKRLRDLADAGGHDRLFAKILRYMGFSLRRMGRSDEALEAAKRAADAAAKCNDRTASMMTRSQLGWWYYVDGRLEEAERCYEKARRDARQADDPYEDMILRWRRAWLDVSRGDLGSAKKSFEEELERARELGFTMAEMSHQNALGEIARFQENAEEARSHYRRHERLAREAGLESELALAELNLAQVELLAARFDEAKRHLEESVRRFEEQSRKAEQTHLLRLTRMVRAAGVLDWERFDDLFAPYRNGWPEEARLFKDHPWLVELAGDYAAAAGRHGRAEQTWRLASDLWQELDDEERAELVREKLKEDD